MKNIAFLLNVIIMVASFAAAVLITMMFVFDPPPLQHTVLLRWVLATLILMGLYSAFNLYVINNPEP